METNEAGGGKESDGERSGQARPDAETPAREPPIISSRPAEPVRQGERIEELDVVRGVALFGILVVNMAFFGWPLATVVGDLNEWEGWADRLAEVVTGFFFEGKFYTMFSLLFGVGMAIQMERAALRGARFWTVYCARLGVLFLIGTIHAYLIWDGDILMVYAVAGFGLLLFRSCAPRTLIVWAGVFLAAPVVLYGVFLGLEMLARGLGGATDWDWYGRGYWETRAAVATEVYRHGSYWDMLMQRVSDRNLLYLGIHFMVPPIFGMFLLGLYAGRRRVPFEIAARLPLFRRLLVWGFFIGFPFNLLFLAAGYYSSLTNFTFIGLLSYLGAAIGGPALCLFYVAGLVLLMGNAGWRRCLRPVACVGRMPLTNYILQSLICTFVFYRHGLGLYGSVGPAGGFGLAVVIYLSQIPLSIWWVRRFQFGPVEWLWRSVSYGRIQPMRRKRDPEDRGTGVISE